MADFDLELDARGLNCPLPILRAKKSIQSLNAGQVLRIVATDPGSVKDFEAFATQTGNELLDSSEEGGKFVFHDVFTENKDAVIYPVPWADDKSISYLMRVNEIEHLLKSLKYKISFWEDKTEISAEAFQKSVENKRPLPLDQGKQSPGRSMPA